MAGIKRRSAGSSRRLLREVNSPNRPQAPLPLVHVTAVGAARDIVDSGQIEMRPCQIFRKDLTYFFVLRPAYRLREGEVKSDEINRFPFVFVVAPDDLGDPFHVYPFDTGGAEAGVFDDRADPYVYLEDYELSSSLEAATQHIGWAFGTAAAYFDGDLKRGLNDGVPAWQDVVRSFANIAGLATSGHNRPDRRASAIEVAYRRHVPLNGHVKLAILPKQYLEEGPAQNTDFMDKLQAAGVEWVTYDWQPNMAPDDARDQISRIAREYFKNSGAL